MVSTSSQRSSSSGSRPKATPRSGRVVRTGASVPATRQRSSASPRKAAAPKLAPPRKAARETVRPTLRTRAPKQPRMTVRASRASEAKRPGTKASASRAAKAVSDIRGAAPRKDRSSVPFLVATAVGAIALVTLVVLLVLSRTPAFTISGIDATASEHVDSATIARLAAVDEGTTLLNVDIGKVQANVARNPWVKRVHVTREFPDTLGISVDERPVFALVVIGSSGDIWALGDDGVWIEPVRISVPDGGDATEAVIARAEELGCLLITSAPASVSPSQGAKATDDTILAVMTYQQQFSEQLSSQALAYSAASTGSIALTLKSGLEISLGAPNDVASKEGALTEIMNKYPNQLTYVNVRVPTKPTYRKVSESSVVQGGSLPDLDLGTSVGPDGAATQEAATGEADSSGSSEDDEGEGTDDSDGTSGGKGSDRSDSGGAGSGDEGPDGSDSADA